MLTVRRPGHGGPRREWRYDQRLSGAPCPAGHPGALPVTGLACGDLDDSAEMNRIIPESIRAPAPGPAAFSSFSVSAGSWAGVSPRRSSADIVAVPHETLSVAAIEPISGSRGRCPKHATTASRCVKLSPNIKESLAGNAGSKNDRFLAHGSSVDANHARENAPINSVRALARRPS